MKTTLRLPVGERRRALVRPVDATAVDDHDHRFAGVAKERHAWMDIWATPLGITMRHDFLEDFIDVVARDDLTDGLRAAQDPGFLCRLEHGV